MPRPAASVDIAPPRDQTDLEAVRALFAEYAASLGFSLGYQGFDAELAGLPGKYAAAEGGALLLAKVGGRPAGAVGLRRLDDHICEMKRLYVRPANRGARAANGRSIGRALAEEIVGLARRQRYARLRLDTIGGKMQAAERLYRSMGFVDIAPYYESPVPGTVYMELTL